jgi:hypothetical protein
MDADLMKVLGALSDNIALLTKQQIAVKKDLTGIPDSQGVFRAGGLFSNYGLDSTVINAGIAPRGIDRAIPAFPTIYTDPIFAFITGSEGSGEDEPNGVCDDAPTAVLETCHQTAALGRFVRSSKEMEVNSLSKVFNRGVMQDIRVMGSLIGQGNLMMPQGGESPDWIAQETMIQMILVRSELQRLLSTRLWQGTPANNSMGGGYREFPGLDMLVATGKVDVFTGVACEALDPDVKDFNYNPVDSDDPNLEAYMTMMAYYLENVASGTGLDPVDWVIAMRPQLFFEICRIWPARYLTAGSVPPAGVNVAVTITGTELVAMRDDMFRNGWLMVNGRRYPVVTDDGIFEDTAATAPELDPGEFASDIYFLPLRAKGMNTMYWEYLDFSNPLTQAQGVLGGNGQYWQTDMGRYLWTMEQKNYCFKFLAKIEPRVLLRTPQLAGRLQHVKYSPLQHLRDPLPESPYFKKGGNEEYTPPTHYSEWNSPRQ